MTTVREYLEAIRDRSTTCLADYATCPTYENRRDAEAAIALLDAAEREVGGAPDFASSETPTSTRYYTERRLLPDPEPAA